MGMIRKLMSATTVGLVDFRSDKERTAAYTKGIERQARQQTALMRQAMGDATGAADHGMTSRAERAAAREEVIKQVAETRRLYDTGTLTKAEFDEIMSLLAEDYRALRR